MADFVSAPTPTPTPAPKQNLDVAGFIQNELGAKFLSKDDSDPDGVLVQVPSSGTPQIDPETGMPGAPTAYETKKMSLSKMMAGEGIDPSRVNVTFGNPNAPLDQGALGFKDQLQMALAKSPEDKLKVIKGAGFTDTRTLPDGTIAVRDGDSWKKADSGFLSQLAADSPAIAGSIAGAEVGGAAGTAVAPGIGTIAGAVIGAGIGAATGKAAQMAAANKLGIRNDNDAQDVATELGKEFVFGAAGETLGLGMRYGPRFIGKAAQTMGKLTNVSDAARLTIADVSARLTGTEMVDNLVWQQAPEAVAKYQRTTSDWLVDTAARGKMTGQNPVLEEGAQMLQGAVEKAKQTMYDDYGNAIKEVNPALLDTKVDMGQTLDAFDKKLQDYGIMNADGTFRNTKTGPLAELNDATSLRRVKEARSLLARASENGSQMPVNDALRVQRNLDDVIELAKGYAGGPGDISSRAVGDIKQFRSSINDTIMKALGDANPQAAQAFSDMNQLYKTRRDFFSDYASKLDDGKIDSFLNKVADPKTGGRDRQAVAQLLGSTGQDAQGLINDLMQRRAAIRTSKIYAKPQGVVPNVISTVANPTKISADALQALDAYAQSTKFIQDLTPGQRQVMLRDANLFNAAVQAPIHALDQRKQMQQQLLQNIPR